MSCSRRRVRRAQTSSTARSDPLHTELGSQKNRPPPADRVEKEDAAQLVTHYEAASSNVTGAVSVRIRKRDGAGCMMAVIASDPNNVKGSCDVNHATLACRDCECSGGAHAATRTLVASFLLMGTPFSLVSPLASRFSGAMLTLHLWSVACICVEAVKRSSRTLLRVFTVSRAIRQTAEEPRSKRASLGRAGRAKIVRWKAPKSHQWPRML